MLISETVSELGAKPKLVSGLSGRGLLLPGQAPDGPQYSPDEDEAHI